MQGLGYACIPLALLLAACTSSPLTLPPPAKPLPQAENVDKSEVPAESVSIVPGSPPDIYALVARGAHRCWFGADGPLKLTHVFHAEAEPPAQGGAAEMVLHERDETLRDKRGARAFRVAFTAVPEGVRVAVTIPKMEQQLGVTMARDVAAWARGGVDCGLSRPPPPVAPVMIKGEPKRAGNAKK